MLLTVTTRSCDRSDEDLHGLRPGSEDPLVLPAQEPASFKRRLGYGSEAGVGRPGPPRPPPGPPPGLPVAGPWPRGRCSQARPHSASWAPCGFSCACLPGPGKMPPGDTRPARTPPPCPSSLYLDTLDTSWPRSLRPLLPERPRPPPPPSRDRNCCRAELAPAWRKETGLPPAFGPWAEPKGVCVVALQGHPGSGHGASPPCSSSPLHSHHPVSLPFRDSGPGSPRPHSIPGWRQGYRGVGPDDQLPQSPLPRTGPRQWAQSTPSPVSCRTAFLRDSPGLGPVSCPSW